MANATERLKICSLASVQAGAGVITTLDSPAAQAQYCRDMYEPLVSAQLSVAKWRFATTYFNLKPNLLAEAPLSRFNCAYERPTDPAVLSVDTVLINDQPIKYDLRGTQIHTSDTAEDDVILQYRFRAEEDAWPPYFRLALTFELASGIAVSVTRNTALGEGLAQKAEAWFAKAKTESALSQPLTPLNLKRLTQARSRSRSRD